MQAPGAHGNRQDLNEFSGPYEHDTKTYEFAEFYRQQMPFVARFLLKMGASLPDAQDVAQEAFVTAFQQWDDIANPRAWIRVVASRILFRRNAQAARTITTEDFSEYSLPPSQDMIGPQLQIPDVLRLISSLPPLQRAVMAMHYDGISHSEIAAGLGISSATVRVHLHRARQELRNLLALGESDSQNDAEKLR